jgi:hypothetical protein
LRPSAPGRPARGDRTGGWGELPRQRDPVYRPAAAASNRRDAAALPADRWLRPCAADGPPERRKNRMGLDLRRPNRGLATVRFGWASRRGAGRPAGDAGRTGLGSTVRGAGASRSAQAVGPLADSLATSAAGDGRRRGAVPSSRMARISSRWGRGAWRSPKAIAAPMRPSAQSAASAWRTRPSRTCARMTRAISAARPGSPSGFSSAFQARRIRLARARSAPESVTRPARSPWTNRG